MKAQLFLKDVGKAEAVGKLQILEAGEAEVVGKLQMNAEAVGMLSKAVGAASLKK